MNTLNSRNGLVATVNGLSPLKKFALCKDAISKQFVNLKEVIDGTGEFLSALERFDMDPTIKEQKTIHEFQEVAENIMTLLTRDTMKVVFVGHTSNGKSTIINAMLWQPVLPVGIGHTTSCFCSVQGTDEEDYLMVGEHGQRQSVTNVKQVAHALQARKRCTNDGPADREDLRNMAKVYWQKRRCRLLGNGVVLIDTPGLDMDGRYDEWIDRYCHDADVFVLVANAESTLKHTEKTFFMEVAKRLSKPNVFLLYNRWDISDDEEDAQAVLQQHFNKGAAFLTQELGLEVIPEQHIYFVSGKEALQHRTRHDKPSPVLRCEGARLRYAEFERFEKAFEEKISESAIRTKFEAHVVRGLDILRVLEEWMTRLTLDVQLVQKLALARLDDRATSLHQLESNGSRLAEDCELLANEMESDVRREVAGAFDLLLNNQLENIVAGFDYCVLKPETLAKYKARLLDHVAQEACVFLCQASGGGVARAYHDTQEAMVARVAQVLGFTPAYTLHTWTRPIVISSQLSEGMVETFQEDIEFRFSLGWHSLWVKLRGGKGYQALNKALADQAAKGSVLDSRESFSLATVLTSSTSAVSLVTAAMTLLSKPSLWKAAMYVGGLCGALYAWEYLTYTNSARERRLKSQAVAHVARHFRDLSPQLVQGTGRMLGGAVRDLQLKTLLCQVDEAKGSLRIEKAALERDIAARGRALRQGELTLGRAGRVRREMEEFYQAHICDAPVDSVDT